MNTDIPVIQSLIKGRNFLEAQTKIEAVVANEATSALEKKSAMHLLGTCQYLQGQVGKSIETFKAILAIDPKHTDAAISLSIIYNDIGRYDEAKSIYKVANQSLQFKRSGVDSELDRKFALKHVELGDMYFKYHRFDEALEDYSRAVRLDGSMLDVKIKMAKVYAKKGFTTRAVQELQQLCSEHQNFVPGRIHLGLMYYSQGNVIDAQVEWERAAKTDPNNEEIRTYLALAKQATETSG